MANQVNATMELMEAPTLKPELDLSGGNPQLQQLPPRYHSVLLSRKLGDDAVRTPRGGFTTHNVVNPPLDVLASGGAATLGL